jgi:glycosyltransferase involved in cell wall biosynthesis
MAPLVSVIIPTWNRREFLARAVRSALTQEDILLEVLVCDDGSDDGTPEMIAAWDDARVHLITGPRAGRPAIPRNRGIAAARGAWLAFLDDDDEWLPAKLSRQLEAAARLGCLAACSDAIRRLPGGVDAGRYLGHGTLPRRLGLVDLLQVNLVMCSSAVIHRSLLEAVSGFPETTRLRNAQDYALWLRVAAITDFAAVDEPLLVYMDAAQTSLRRFSHAWRQRRNVLMNYLDWCVRHSEGRRFLPILLGYIGWHFFGHPLASFFRRFARTLKQTMSSGACIL